MPTAVELLNAQNVTRIVDAVQDIRTTDTSLRFLGRTAMVNADDTEIIAKYTGRIVVADIIADDAVAPVRAGNPITLQTTEIPNIKHGEVMSQRGLNALGKLQRQYTNRDMGVFEDYIGRRTTELVRGVLMRMETLVAAMLTDAYSYDHLGIILSGLTWNMPSDLKVTPSNLWSDAANATPVTDIQTILRTGREKYGVNFNRIEMSTTSFLYMVKTAEFKNMTQLYSSLAFPANTYPSNDINLMTQLAGMILGIQIVIDDRQFWAEALAGTQSSASVLPTGKVLFTSTEFDNNSNIMDWANGVVTETKPYTVGNMFGGFDSEREGPVGYVTAANPQGNPPGCVMWAVARGFPRKHMEASSAVLTAY